MPAGSLTALIQIETAGFLFSVTETSSQLVPTLYSVSFATIEKTKWYFPTVFVVVPLTALGSVTTSGNSGYDNTFFYSQHFYRSGYPSVTYLDVRASTFVGISHRAAPSAVPGTDTSFTHLNLPIIVASVTKSTPVGQKEQASPPRPNVVPDYISNGPVSTISSTGQGSITDARSRPPPDTGPMVTIGMKAKESSDLLGVVLT